MHRTFLLMRPEHSTPVSDVTRLAPVDACDAQLTHRNGSVMRTACMIFKMLTSYFFEKTACTAVHNHQDELCVPMSREMQLNRRAGVNGSLPARGDGVDGTAGAAPAAGGS